MLTVMVHLPMQFHKPLHMPLGKEQFVLQHPTIHLLALVNQTVGLPLVLGVCHLFYLQYFPVCFSEPYHPLHVLGREIVTFPVGMLH